MLPHHNIVHLKLYLKRNKWLRTGTILVKRRQEQKTGQKKSIAQQSIRKIACFHNNYQHEYNVIPYACPQEEMLKWVK